MRKDKEQEFSSREEKRIFGLYQHVAQMFMKTNEEEEYGEPTYSEPSRFSFDVERNALEVEYCEMYSRPQITFAFLQSLSEAFKTKYINLQNGVTEKGCETCDYGSNYGVVIKIKNIGINFNDESEP